MATTNLSAVNDQIQKYWAPVFTKRLRENLLLGSLVNKDYEGAIARQGDTVRVSQIVDIDGQLLTIGTDADSFSPEAVTTTYVDIKADKRAVASVEFADLVELQSQVDRNKVQDTLMFAMSRQINNYLYSLVSPSTSAPDHLINGVTDFNATQLGACRVLAAQAKWAEDNNWYALLDPQYYQDLLNSTTVASNEFGATDAPSIGGKIALKRMGFNVLQDNSRAVDQGLLFHPDFMHMVQQTEVQVKISDLHSQKKFGFVMSVDLVFGAKLGLQGDVKHIKVFNT
jgi:hypothetical protein